MKTKHQEIFGCDIPETPSYLLKPLLSRMIKMGVMPVDQQKTLETIAKKGIIVFALKYRSKLDLLYIKTRFFQMGLPHPYFVFDMRTYSFQPLLKAWKLRFNHFIHYLKRSALPNPYEEGFFREQILAGKTGAMFLLGEEGYYQRAILFGEDPLQHLLEIQKDCEKPIFVVPCALVYSRHPVRGRWFSRENVGRIRKAISFVRGFRHAVIEIGEPINLQEILPELSEVSSERRTQIFKLRQELINSIDRIHRAVVGPALKSKLELKETILNNPKLQTYMRRRAKSTGQELWKIRKEADSYLEEIAADYSYTLVKFMERILGWVWDNMFDGVEVDEEGLRRLKKEAQRNTLVYIPSHKSHIDYLILSYILFQHNLSPPFIAAGKNLSFWPLGPIFRRGGAFFIRRTFKGQRFYAEVFSLYVKTMIHYGHNIEFFIEGGRSRTGKLILPKLGLLSILIQGVEEGYCDDLMFVPTAICYDRIPEEEAHVRELTGGTKKAESLKQLFGLRRFLRRRYGRVYVRFAKPISLAQYLERNKLDLKSMRPRERHAMYRDFAFRIINSINQVSVVTPHSLLASSLLTTSRSGISSSSLKFAAGLFYKYLQYINAKFARTFSNYDVVVEDTLVDLESTKIIERVKEPDEEEELIVLEEKKRHILEYYKNNIIHFFLPISFVSISVLAQRTFEPKFDRMLRDYRFLKDLFKYEFAYDSDISDEKQIESVCQFFTDGELFTQAELFSGYILSHEGLRACELFASLLTNYLEGYRVCLRSLRLLEKKEQYLDKDFLKKMLGEGRKALKLGFIERPESVSKVMYQNALRYMEEKGLIAKKVEHVTNSDEKRKLPREYFVKGHAFDKAQDLIKEINKLLNRHS